VVRPRRRPRCRDKDKSAAQPPLFSDLGYPRGGRKIGLGSSLGHHPRGGRSGLKCLALPEALKYWEGMGIGGASRCDLRGYNYVNAVKQSLVEGAMDVQFVASVAPIVRDLDAARSFYRDALGLSFEGEEGDYLFTHKLEGTKHFGLWPLSEAANACFGTTEWPSDVPVPQASIEFEVADVAAAAAELEAKGYRLIHAARTEPWAQITARLLSPEGLLVAVCYTTSLHDTRDG
jgi:catechol 2,3-dioxygenase-like lactoylglutathione lyase family enzyme